MSLLVRFASPEEQEEVGIESSASAVEKADFASIASTEEKVDPLYLSLHSRKKCLTVDLSPQLENIDSLSCDIKE